MPPPPKKKNGVSLSGGGFPCQRGKATTNVSTDTSQVGKLLQALHYV